MKISMTKREVERRRVIEAKLDAIGYYDDGSEGDEVDVHDVLGENKKMNKKGN
jgi:hypothetical protein